MTDASRRQAWILGATVIVFTAPVVVDVCTQARHAFIYLAMDAFYYLTIARNHHASGLFSFDGERLTNGYHPLWQWVLSPAYGVLERIGEPWLLSGLVLLCVALIAAGLVLLGQGWARCTGRLSPLFPLVVPGVTALVSTPFYLPEHDRPEFASPETARPVYTTLWSYANGMETPLVLLLFCAGVWFYARREELRSWRATLGLAGLALGLTLARLDHGLFALALLGAVIGGARAREDRETTRRGLVALGLFAAGLVAYCAHNEWVYGSAVPISGLLKSQIVLGSAEVRQNLTDVAAFFTGDYPHERWLPSRSRVFQLLFPMLVALIQLPATLRLARPAPWLRLRAGRDRLDALLAWTAAAVLGLGLYNLVAVSFSAQGPWYFPVSVLFASMAVLRGADRLGVVRRLAEARSRVLVAWLLVCAGGIAAYFLRAQYHPRHKADAAAFYHDEAPKIRAYYGDRPPRLIEVDDGLVAFATGFQAMCGTGFALDAGALPAYRTRRLGELALARGFDRLASFSYRDFSRVALTQAVMRRAFLFHVPGEFPVRFTPEYRSADGRFAVIRMSRK